MRCTPRPDSCRSRSVESDPHVVHHHGDLLVGEIALDPDPIAHAVQVVRFDRVRGGLAHRDPQVLDALRRDVGLDLRGGGHHDPHQ